MYLIPCELISMGFQTSSGGTDIISCFAGQNPIVPVYRGEIQTRNLGMAVESWNDEGLPSLFIFLTHLWFSDKGKTWLSNSRRGLAHGLKRDKRKSALLLIRN